MAKTAFEYSIRSKDETSQGVKSAQSGIQSLEKSMQNINKVAALMVGGGAIAGVVQVMRRLYQGAAEAEAAFIKLNPDMANAAGSAAEFTKATDGLKAAIGGVIAGGLSPLRTWLGEVFTVWTYNINAATEYKNLLNDLGKTNAGFKMAQDLMKLNEQLKELKREQVNLLSGGGTARTVASAETLRQSTDLSVRIRGLQQAIDHLSSRAKDYVEPVEKATAATGKLETAIIKWWDTNQNNGASTNPWVYNPTAFKSINKPEEAAPWSYRSPFQSDQMRLLREGPERAASAPYLPDNYLAASASSSAGTNPFQGLMLAFGPVIQQLGGMLSAVSGLNAILNPVTTILTAMMNVLTPVINSLLEPLVGILVIFGETLGKILVPVLQALAPVIDFIGKAFLWLYNGPIMAFANLFITIGNILYNAVVGIANFVDWMFNWSRNQRAYRDLREGWLTPIDTTSLATAGATVTQNNGGAGASFSQARAITVNVVINTDVITGESGGFRELAIKMSNEIQAVIALGLA
jgi:hypothetical protein